MDKSATMLEYERITGDSSTQVITDGCHVVGIEVWNYKYINWLELHEALHNGHVERIEQECIKNCSNCFLSCLNRGCSGIGYRAVYSKE